MMGAPLLMLNETSSKFQKISCDFIPEIELALAGFLNLRLRSRSIGEIGQPNGKAECNKGQCQCTHEKHPASRRQRVERDSKNSRAHPSTLLSIKFSVNASGITSNLFVSHCLFTGY